MGDQRLAHMTGAVGWGGPIDTQRVLEHLERICLYNFGCLHLVLSHNSEHNIFYNVKHDRLANYTTSSCTCKTTSSRRLVNKDSWLHYAHPYQWCGWALEFLQGAVNGVSGLQWCRGEGHEWRDNCIKLNRAMKKGRLLMTMTSFWTHPHLPWVSWRRVSKNEVPIRHYNVMPMQHGCPWVVG